MQDGHHPVYRINQIDCEVNHLKLQNVEKGEVDFSRRKRIKPAERMTRRKIKATVMRIKDREIKGNDNNINTLTHISKCIFIELIENQVIKEEEDKDRRGKREKKLSGKFRIKTSQ
jgi:hypothetical protein